MLIGRISWILWLPISKIGNISTIGLFFMLFLFEFIAEVTTFLLRYIYVKVFITLIIIAASLVLQKYACMEDTRHENSLYNTWMNLRGKY